MKIKYKLFISASCQGNIYLYAYERHDMSENMNINKNYNSYFKWTLILNCPNYLLNLGE